MKRLGHSTRPHVVKDIVAHAVKLQLQPFGYNMYTYRLPSGSISAKVAASNLLNMDPMFQRLGSTNSLPIAMINADDSRAIRLTSNLAARMWTEIPLLSA